MDSSALVFGVVPHGETPDARRRLWSALAAVRALQEAVAPGLLRYEVAHVVFRKRHEELRGVRANPRHVFERLLGAIRLVDPPDELLADAGRVARRRRVNFYDAIFIELAKRRGEPLLTADRAMSDHAATMAVRAYLLPDDLSALERDFHVGSA